MLQVRLLGSSDRKQRSKATSRHFDEAEARANLFDRFAFRTAASQIGSVIAGRLSRRTM